MGFASYFWNIDRYIKQTLETMNNKKGIPFPLLIIAIVLGWTIVKQFDFENLKFEKPAMAVIYILTFVMTVYMIFKNNNEDVEK